MKIETAPNDFQAELPDGLHWEQAHCCVCGGTSSSRLLETTEKLQRRGVRFTLVRCDNCGHVYQNPRPNLESIGWFYPNDYGPHQPPASCQMRAGNDSTGHQTASFIKATGPWSLRTGLRAIPGLKQLYYWLVNSNSEILPAVPCSSPSALEIGSGSGRFLEKLQAAGWTAHGLEPTAAPAQHCRERGLSVSTGNIETVDIPSNTYDAVFAWMVLEHLHQPELALQKIYQSLKPAGIFVFSVPNYGSLEARIFGKYWYAIELVHLNYFSVAEIRKLLGSSGFALQVITYQNNVRNLVGSLGILVRELLGLERLGNSLIRGASDMSMWSELLLAPWAKLLSAMHQSGRITLVARKN